MRQLGIITSLAWISLSDPAVSSPTAASAPQTPQSRRQRPSDLQAATACRIILSRDWVTVQGAAPHLRAKILGPPANETRTHPLVRNRYSLVKYTANPKALLHDLSSTTLGIGSTRWTTPAFSHIPTNLTFLSYTCCLLGWKRTRCAMIGYSYTIAIFEKRILPHCVSLGSCLAALCPVQSLNVPAPHLVGFPWRLVSVESM